MGRRRGRPDISGHADRFEVPAADGRLSVTFLGVTSLLVSDGTSAVLTDGFFSRPSAQGAPATHRAPSRSPPPGAQRDGWHGCRRRRSGTHALRPRPGLERWPARRGTPARRSVDRAGGRRRRPARGPDHDCRAGSAGRLRPVHRDPHRVSRSPEQFSPQTRATSSIRGQARLRVGSKATCYADLTLRTAGTRSPDNARRPVPWPAARWCSPPPGAADRTGDALPTTVTRSPPCPGSTRAAVQPVRALADVVRSSVASNTDPGNASLTTIPSPPRCLIPDRHTFRGHLRRPPLRRWPRAHPTAPRRGRSDHLATGLLRRRLRVGGA
jgi:hypothetical protein